ncbi:MAG: FAD-binding oxidoreductase, partial [Gemmatimonadota bacterium]
SLRSISRLGAVLTERGAAEEAGLDLSGGHVLADAYSFHEVENAFHAMEKAALPVTWLSAEDVRALVHGRGFLGGYRIEGGGGLDPQATAVALAEAARDEGATVLEGVLVNDVSRRKGRMVCATDEGEIQAEMVVYATHTDSRRFSSFLGDEIVPIRGQGMLVEPGPPVYRGSFSTHWKLNVWRSDAQGRLHLGGWRHDAWDRSYWKMRPELDDHLQENLQGWFQSTFPEAGHLSVARRWSGIFGWTADYLPLVGPLPGRVGELVIAGFSGGGLPFAFEAGRVIEAIVSEKEPVPGGGLLNPRRFT